MTIINKYLKCYANLLGGEIAGDTFAVDYLSDTIKARLHTASYVPNLDTHETIADLTNELAASGGYTAGGVTLAGKAITVTAANSWATARANGTAYAVDDIVRPSAGNGHLYRCIVAGTSHASTPPTFPTVSGQTVTDGTVTWAEIGRGLVQIDANDPSWSSATLTGIRYMVIVKDTGTAGTSPLLWLIDFETDQQVTNGTFTGVLHAYGLEVFSTP
jgi:hypothetical protein